MFALAVQLAPVAASAQLGPVGLPPKQQLLFTSLTAGVWNPWGAQTDLIVHYRRRLWDSKKLLFGVSHVGAKLITRVNPAYVRVGFGVELQPLAVLTLRANYEHRGYFGTVGMLQSWPSPRAEHDDDTRSERKRGGASYITSGHQLTAQAIVRAKVGPIAILNEFALHYFRLDLRPGDKVFYEAFYDTLTPGKGSVLINNAHLLYISSFGLIAGVRYTVVHAFYPDDWLRDASGRLVENPNTPNHKIGPIIGYTFKSSSKSFRAPTILLVLNWWLESRYRAGQQVSQALPYGIIAFTFSGDIWRQE
ncbi:MAG: hypothetical protein CSA65_00645 [Proteobacteria bacterium]|nr:MAG: hypothetical protein CSA65_00645 [Pseudomonadota bacterium]